MLSIEPRILLIPFDAIQPVVFKRSITICNTSSQKTRLAIQLPAESSFQFSKLRGQFYSGESTTIQVIISPKTWDLQESVLYISCSHLEEPIPVEIKGIFD